MVNFTDTYIYVIYPVAVMFIIGYLSQSGTPLAPLSEVLPFSTSNTTLNNFDIAKIVFWLAYITTFVGLINWYIPDPEPRPPVPRYVSPYRRHRR